MDDIQFKQVESVIQGLMDEHGIPGVSIAIVKIDPSGESSCRCSGLGLSGIKQKTPATSSTKMGIGSITKCFTSALLALQLQNEKTIKWDTPLGDIFGEEFQFCDQFRSERASLRDVLAHKMGIELGESDFGWLCGAVDRKAIIKNLRALPTAADFRTDMMYNNFMYTVAAKVSEKIAKGETWESLIQDNFFSLLGMSESGFMHQAEHESIADLATAYMKTERGLRGIPLALHKNCDSIAPAGSIYSSANDMAKWMTFLLNKGKLFGADGIEIIEKRQLEKCWKPQFALPRGKQEWDGYVHMPKFPASETRDTYGFGWYMGTYRGHRFAAHGGELFGYDGLLTLYHDSGFGVYTCFNGPGGESAYIGNQLIHYYVADLMLNETPWLDAVSVRTFPEPWGDKATFFIPRVHVPIQRNLPSSRPVSEYCGKYSHDFMGTIIINIDIEKSVLIMTHGNGRFLMYPNGSADEFRLEGIGVMDFLHELDLFAPTEWMMVKFRASPNDATVEGLVCSLYESGPIFLKNGEENIST